MIETIASVDARQTDSSHFGSQLKRLIFVGGCPRSGTTLVQRVLDCHPQIYGGPEFVLVPRIVNLFQDMQGMIRLGAGLDAILDEKDLVHAFRSLLVALLLPKLQTEEVSYLSEKTPNNALAFPWMEECVPEARKILVVRDPRDVVSSMLEVGRRQQRRQGWALHYLRDTVGAVDYMNQHLKAGLKLAETSANCLIIYYEDVVSDPLGVANQIYRFIGVHEIGRLDLENEQFETFRNRDSYDWYPPGTMSGGVEKGRVGVAEQRLSRSDLAFISANTIRHPLVTDHYDIQSSGRTLAARWCVARCRVLRVKNGIPRLGAFVRRRLTQ